MFKIKNKFSLFIFIILFIIIIYCIFNVFFCGIKTIIVPNHVKLNGNKYIVLIEKPISKKYWSDLSGGVAIKKVYYLERR